MSEDHLQHIKDRFIAEWAVLGQAWGISRTMAQVQALLLLAEEPLNTDQIMAELAISRGNAHNNIKELVNWGLARKVVVRGDRKEYFVGEQDPWIIFCKVARERKRREIEPLLETLSHIHDELEPLSDERATSLQEQIDKLADFARMGDRVLDRIGRSEKSLIMKWLMKMS